MICPSCGSNNIIMIDAKLYEEGEYRKPIKCQDCGGVFTIGSCKKSYKIKTHEHRMDGVVQMKDGEVVGEYSSLTEASKATGLTISNICHVCRGIRKTAGGFTWEYRKEKKKF